jgi:hypothetical protein
MKLLAVGALIFALSALSVAGDDVVTNTVLVRVEIVQPPPVATNALPPMPQNAHIPLSVKMRQAAQEARGKAAPWAQRFIATKVEALPLTQTEDDNDGVPRGKVSYTTNYVVTLAPVAGDEPLAVWGAVKAKTIRVVTRRPTVKGDEFTLYPEVNQVSP